MDFNLLEEVKISGTEMMILNGIDIKMRTGQKDCK